MHIGFLGLDNMGGPMAQNLIKAGHQFKMFDLLQASVALLVEVGAQAETSPATQDPARKAFASLPMVANGLLNRMMWKYQRWLQGYNGGPMPHPTQRIYQRDMVVLRKGLEAAGLNPTSDLDEAFFVGHPV